MKNHTKSARRLLKSTQTQEFAKPLYLDCIEIPNANELLSKSEIAPRASISENTETKRFVLELEQQLSRLKEVLHVREVESERLLHQLIKTQEQLNVTTSSKNQKIENSENSSQRLNAILQTHPGILEASRTQVDFSADRNDHKSSWIIDSLFLNNDFYRTVEFQISIENGVASITTNRSTNSVDYNDWLTGPGSPVWDDAITLAVMQGDAHSGTNKNLSQLGTKGWLTLKRLVTKIADYIEYGNDKRLSSHIEKQSILIGVRRLQKTLEGWPKLFRYDHAMLVSSSKGYGYSYIEIQLDNISIGARTWPTLTFRIATSDKRGERFGTHPRLEFNKATSGHLEYWQYVFAANGAAQLELRFASPNEMDTDIWQKIPMNDKLLITGIISTLTQQLSNLQELPMLNNPDWGAWAQVATLMREILKSRQDHG